MNIRLRLFVMMALQLAIWGAWAPKLFPYMAMLGFSVGKQALVGGSWGIAATLGVFFANQFVDRHFSADRFLAASHVIGGACLVGVAFSTTFWPFFTCYLIYSLVYVPTLSVANTLAFANLSNPAKDFGGVRMGGSIGWVLASWPFVFLLGTHAGAEEVRSIFLVSGIISFALAGYAISLPHTPPRTGVATDHFAWRQAIFLLREPSMLLLYVVTFIDSVVHNGYFVVSDAFLVNRVGIAGNLSMVILSLGQVSEIATMAMLGRVLRRLGWRLTMIIGILGHAARFLVFSFAADSVATIIAVQLLHGVCYAFFFATVYIFADEAFPKDVRVSAQGLFNLLILGLGMVVSSFVFPMLVSNLTHVVTKANGGVIAVVDYHTLFLAPAGLAGLGALLLLFFRPRTPRPAGAAALESNTGLARFDPAGAKA